MLLSSLEYRGNDASGVCVQYPDGRINLYKDHEPAWRFICGTGYQKWMDDRFAEGEPQTVIVHTRKMTKGTYMNNDNNHPMFRDKCAVVHNGFVSNDDQIFRELGVQRAAETDSDAIRAIVDKYGFTKNLLGSNGHLSKMSGSVAAAILHPEFPGKLLLLRSNNPLYIATTPNMLAFASDKQTATQTLSSWVKRLGVEQRLHANGLAYIPMANDSGWFFGEGGLEFRGEFQCKGWSRGAIRYNVNTPDYERRRREQQETWDKAKAEAEEKRKVLAEGKTDERKPIVINSVSSTGKGEYKLPDIVCCPNEKCEMDFLDTSAIADRSTPLWKLRCVQCKTRLTEAREATIQ